MVEMLVCQYRFRLGSVQTFCLQIFLVELKFNSSMRMDNEWDGVGKSLLVTMWLWARAPQVRKDVAK